MSLPFQIDPQAGVPIYQQVIEQLKRAISLGIYQVGEPIPTIREMALHLQVNPNTVAKGVRELEREGLLITKVGKGSFVSEQALGQSTNDRDQKGQTLTRQYAKDMSWLGFQEQESVDLLRQNWESRDE